ncbi:hypothetical protein P152DRAFT_459625 [Eremomyces bilateralis CBS 781.70]|uniref:ER-bound oxygenase mpaB/mpaB'/Rubber oxygenase catalytic domain-containing protein n=1 Tax=Eremomyces bilateralis CBS 781.70 TaxID=1392243 RepID=A0A6G1FZW7_9PEZI|nr:uncharacterized protein P152DRAFT_459625 [Eremomyces bilateralis CBS 781.70]KAF1811221.1 hypothetical protein P152DRAFT_459625 [Eremomyces bilateralis CBS 781.70]
MEFNGVVRAWGHSFIWTEEHWTSERMAPLKVSYDELAHDCYTILKDIKDPKAPAGKRDMYALLRDNADTHPRLKEMWEEINTVPDWVDWDQIQRGQDVFYRYLGANLVGLTFQSLLGGMGAARVVETLARTGGFSTKVARHRLLETTQHILQSTQSLDAIQPGGVGFASSVRVRLLHSAVRERIMKMAAQRPDYFDLENWGVPINDIDQAGTIGTFCSTLVFVSLPRQGIYPSDQESKDYIALWRYIGYILGAPTDFFETPSKARAIMESLLLYEVQPSDMSKVMANNIIKCLQDQPPTYSSGDMLTVSARWMNGRELSDQLGLANPSYYYWALMAGQCLFFMALDYSHRMIPWLDRRKIQASRDFMQQALIEGKDGLKGEKSLFQFRYIPEYSTVTELGKEESTKRHGSAEWRNLQTLLAAGAFMFFTAYSVHRVAKLVF